MKLVIGGSTGLVGTELVRQALSHPGVTSIVGLSRRETTVPSGSSDAAGKLNSVVCDDFENYPDSVKKELEGADACIWTIAVTPSKVKDIAWDEICKICRDYAVTAVQTLATLPRKPDQPLRFVYMSGHFTLRKGDATVQVLKDNGLEPMARMRGDAETQILEYAEQSNGAVQASIAKSGFIAAPGRNPPPVPGLPTIQLEDISAALLDQVIGGFEKDTLVSDDMTRIGQKALAELQKV